MAVGGGGAGTKSGGNSQHYATLSEIFGKTTTHRCSRKTTSHRKNYVFSPPPKNPAPTAPLDE